ncbi:hypothetical protein [Methanosarcina mazei]|uniref:hypothetical protein n=1 Tax=Methanosarcina mazei TaxID=2209 RepID=UPI000AE0C103|nr:hypothetical protein [Methanosarcina mazei]
MPEKPVWREFWHGFTGDFRGHIYQLSEAKRSDIKVFNLGVNALLKAGLGMYDYF